MHKIVFYGPSETGKTKALQQVRDGIAEKNCSLISWSKHFESLTLKLNDIDLFLMTAPGALYLNNSRLQILHNVSGVVFFIDAQRNRQRANERSFDELIQNILRLKIQHLPIVFYFVNTKSDESLEIAALQRKYCTHREHAHGSIFQAIRKLLNQIIEKRTVEAKTIVKKEVQKDNIGVEGIKKFHGRQDHYKEYCNDKNNDSD